MMRKIFLIIFMGLVAFAIAACDDHYDMDDQFEESMTVISTDQSFFKDGHGRYLTLNGVNFSGSTKVPAEFNPISYVGKPAPLDQLDKHFSIMRDLGFNAIRLLVIWEAVEPYGSGSYDVEYLDYIEQVVAKAEKYGIYCLMDMHQDGFSRHLFAMYDDGRDMMSLVDPREIELAELYGFNNKTMGDGAPAWAVQLCLPEKDVNGPEWGLPYWDASNWSNTSSVLPFTMWGINIFGAVDVLRCFATMLAGRDVYPHYFHQGVHIQDYLQESYANAWRQIAMRVGKYPNLIGYDIMNEPPGVYIVFAIYALLAQDAKSMSGVLSDEVVENAMDTLLQSYVDQGVPESQAQVLREILIDYDILPRSVDQLAAAGFMEKISSPYAPDISAAIGMNSAFNKTYLQPFLSMVGQAIQEEDPNAIIFLEETLGLPETGISGQWIQTMTRPEGLDQVAFLPHWYTDIYPFFGMNVPPREFTEDEKRHRHYVDDIAGVIEPAAFSLGNPPVGLGEFGTYYNFGGIEKSVEQDYIISSLVINPYYEAFEELLLHRFLWCYSPENTSSNGEGWNREDFSLLDFNQQPRSWQAYSRTVPRFASGRIRSMHFHSPLHYFEEYTDKTTPFLEFEMEMDAREVSAPTEIFVPPLQYVDGFYVYVSDGTCQFDSKRHILYWRPSNDDPGSIHSIRIRPPYDDDGDDQWDYFFNDDQVLEGLK